MKQKTKALGIFIAAVLILTVNVSNAQKPENTDKTLSPYFFVKTDDPDLDQLPLKSTSVKVDIAGVIADVVVTQVYKNEGKNPLEAIYIFPASTRAAVYGMKMTIGERAIIAKIQKREEARRQYEQAKQAGKSASLLEQHRPNVFQMNVANILPSDVIKVELKYTELLVPRDGVYEFIYPTVVGPRYTDQPAEDALTADQWIKNPYLHEGDLPTYSFDASVNISAGLPIQKLTCPSHKVRINYNGPSLANIGIDSSEKHGGNRDFILKYRLAGGKIESGLLLYEGEKENFFLLMIQPPKRVTNDQIPPREYIFIVDVSGSMNGFPLNISKKLLKDLIGNLRPTDKFNVLLFAGGSKVMAESSLSATPENIKRAINIIDRQRGGGGTRLLPALKRALSLPGAEGYARSVIIVTDGYVSVEKEAFDLIRDNLGNANMFTFGIGSSVNRYLIEGMARIGMGEPFVISRPEQARKKALEFRKLIQKPVLTNIRVRFNRFEAYDVEPPSIPDVMAERPVIIFGKWRGRPYDNIEIKGLTGNRVFKKILDAGKVTPQETNLALRYLWARHRIALLSDYNRLNLDGERVMEVTSLGLTYNLLTAYTSFVAIDTRIRLKNGQATTVRQPLPLPKGVSDLAVGGMVSPMKSKLAYAPSTHFSAQKRMLTESPCEDKKEEKEYSGEALLRPVIDKTDTELGKITVSKGFSEKTIRKFLERHIPAIRACFNLASTRKPGLKGKVVFRFVIDSVGRVTKVSVMKSMLKIKSIEQCIIQKLKCLTFPAPAGGGKGTIFIEYKWK